MFEALLAILRFYALDVRIITKLYDCTPYNDT